MRFESILAQSEKNRHNMGMDEEKNTPQQNTPADDELVDTPQDTPEPLTESFDDDIALLADEPDETPADDDLSFFSDDLDIESALASVANLSAVITDTTEILQVESQPKSAPKETVAPVFESNFPRPPLFTLERGQMPSVIPALALMAIGAGLTFLLITGAESVNMGLVGLLAIGGVCVLFLLIWLASGRWARGALFLALTIGITTGILVFLSQTAWGVAGFPLLVSGWGVAVILSGFLSPKYTAQGLFVGVLLMVIGAVGFIVTTGLFPSDLIPVVNQYGAITAGIGAVLLFMPAIFKRHR